MPRNNDIKKTLVIGSGPIIIGQAAEFDYAGTQACQTLRDEGIKVVLVNSNPATIMTDNKMADSIYIEPLTLTTLKRIIDLEKPDSILSGLGGQTGLTLCMQLAKDGFLHHRNIKILGASPETIDKAEDRQIFKDTMHSIGQPVVASKVVNTPEHALEFAEEIGFPIIVRPAFTLGGNGGGIAKNREMLCQIAKRGIMLSPINQILVEKCISGWKEIEFEVIRDGKGNVIAVCSMENIDPVGVHTGDSIVVAPALTISDREYQMLRSSALNIITALNLEGGCNCQFALNPDSFEYAVIEVNPRVSRSSALASKATGYPIAKVATKIAIGYTLDEIINDVTGNTCAAFEPTLDYVALKFPKWAFDKFVYANRDLGTQMKATGEVMSISRSFEAAIMKAIRGAEIGIQTLEMPKYRSMADSEILDILFGNATDERIFVIFEALFRGISVDIIANLTKIDKWFLYKLHNIAKYQKLISTQPLTHDLYIRGKRFGFTDSAIRSISNTEFEFTLKPVYKMVDTCAAEFSSVTPYFYSSFENSDENEALDFIKDDARKRVVVLGSGPIRIGQGIEFDYASVHCVWALKQLGYDVIIINNNPETVSTDFSTADRLYFEPLTPEDVMHVIEIEQPVGVFVAFGGQTAIKLSKVLNENGVKILGTSVDSIDLAEDRKRFDTLLENLNIKRPPGFAVTTKQQALRASRQLSYPVLVRPSYVLGGQNMIIAFDDDDMDEYMDIILKQKQDSPVLIDKYISGIEIEIDAICDGREILVPGIIEHIERTGIHSGDSISIYPSVSIAEKAHQILEISEKLCSALKIIGLVNIQYVISNNDIYVIEVNPRASRTVPYLSKVSGVPICELAVQVCMGKSLRSLSYESGIYRSPKYSAVKVPVFSFDRLADVDNHLGPEMKSTGEVLGVGKTLEEALFKGLTAAGYNMKREGGVLITVRNSDKNEIVDIARKYSDLGFSLFSTEGTAQVLKAADIDVQVVNKIHQNSENTMTLLDTGKIDYIISTSAKGRNPQRDSVKIRMRAVQLGIPCLTSLDTANALVSILKSHYSQDNTSLIDVTKLDMFI